LAFNKIDKVLTKENPPKMIKEIKSLLLLHTHRKSRQQDSVKAAKEEISKEA